MFYKCMVILFVCVSADLTFALSVHYGGMDLTMPFHLQYQDVENQREIVLQMANFSEATVSVLAWQLDLEVRPVEDAQGTLLFFDVAAPPDGLFGEASAPLSDPALPPPTDKIFVQDMSSEFMGEPLGPGTARNILLLRLQASANAAGRFQLVMPAGSDPEVDSSWLDSEEFTPHLFENTTASSFPGYILLGTIHVGEPAIFPPGDYDRDGQVTAADYDRWRGDFGNIADPPGSGADGNGDGVVDAADYIIWRRHFTATDTGKADLTVSMVPEPHSLSVTGVGLAMALFMRQKRRQANSVARSRNTPTTPIFPHAAQLATMNAARKYA